MPTLPGGWVWNVFEAQVLHRLDSKRRYQMRFEDGIVIWVPATLGRSCKRRLESVVTIM